MNNVDRFIRVIYTEADLARLAIWGTEAQQTVLSVDDYVSQKIRTLFNFERLSSKGSCGIDTSTNKTAKDRYRQSIVETYLHVYPKNYSDNEVHLLLNKMVENVGNEFRLKNGVNSLYVFPYCAREMLIERCGEFYVRSENLLEWDGILNKIDSNALFAAYSAFYKDQSHVEFLAKYADERLRKILSKGYAENHAHLWGSGEYAGINWYCFLYLSAHDPMKIGLPLSNMVKERYRDKNALQQEEMVLAFKKVPIIRALLNVRYIVDAYGGSLPQETTPNRIDAMLRQLFFTQDETSLKLLIEQEEFSWVVSLGEAELNTSIPQQPSDYLEYEQGFLYELFSLLGKHALSPMCQYALNVYISALMQFKLCMLQDNLNIGFKRFNRVQNQKKAFLELTKFGISALSESIFDKYYRCGNTKYAEFRIGPTSKKSLYSLLKGLDKANQKVYDLYKGKSLVENKISYGLIIHFHKSEYNSEIVGGQCRKYRSYEKLQKDFRQLAAMFESSSEKNEYIDRIVAIDAASFETSTRPEMFGPIFRTFTNEISSRFNTGLTYHVGEDFVSLPNGLRAIDEALSFLELNPGDRLGHATALGIDVDDYYVTKRNYVTNTVQEQVDDIAWLHQVIAEDAPDRFDLLLYLEKEYNAVSSLLYEGLYNEPPRLYTHQASMLLRGDDPYFTFESKDGLCLKKHVLCFGDKYALQDKNQRYQSAKSRELYFLYQFSCRLKRQGAYPYIKQVDGKYVEAVKVAQSAMRKKVHKSRVTIEANPTSNRKISPVNRYIDLHILKLNQHGLTMPKTMNASADRDLPITINTDDSGVFQTDLALEYAFIFEAMCREDFDLEETYAYLDYLRELSLQQNFVCRSLGSMG